MTEEQRRQALALCDRILATTAELQANLREAREAIEQTLAVVSGPPVQPQHDPLT